MSAITSEQVRAARALIRWEQKELAAASSISLPSIKRLETSPGPLAAQTRTVDAIRAALEAAGVEFIPENGGGAGVRLRDRAGAPDEGLRPDELDATNDDKNGMPRWDVD